MSKTIVDMAKVTQMLDAGWTIQLRKVATYVAKASHASPKVWERAKQRNLEATIAAGWNPEDAREMVEGDFDEPGIITTDDFTPEQALTMLAYKVHGEFAPEGGQHVD